MSLFKRYQKQKHLVKVTARNQTDELFVSATKATKAIWDNYRSQKRGIAQDLDRDVSRLKSAYKARKTGKRLRGGDWGDV